MFPHEFLPISVTEAYYFFGQNTILFQKNRKSWFSVQQIRLYAFLGDNMLKIKNWIISQQIIQKDWLFRC